MSANFNPWAKMLEQRLLQVKATGKGKPWEFAALKHQWRQKAKNLLPNIQQNPPKFRPVYRVGTNGVSMVITGDQELSVMSGSAFNRKDLTDEQKQEQREYQARRKAADAWIEDITGEERPDAIHLFSWRSKKKCRDKATAFWEASKGDRIFLTLTFIEDITHRRAARILNKFFTVLRKDFPGLEYLWVAEPQKENNDRIHFHVILNKFLPVERYNALWVLQQYNAGLAWGSVHPKNYTFISKKEIKKRFRVTMERLADPTNQTGRIDREGTIGEVLNPATMRNATTITGLSNYLTAYVTKQDDTFQFGCRPWHCSRGVSEMFTRELTYPSTFKKFCSTKINRTVNKGTGEVRTAKPFHKQFCSAISILRKSAAAPHLTLQRKVNRWIMIERASPHRHSLKRLKFLGKVSAVLDKGRTNKQKNLHWPGVVAIRRKSKYFRKIDNKKIRRRRVIECREDIPVMSLDKYRQVYLKDSKVILTEPAVIAPEIRQREPAAMQKKKYTDADWAAFNEKYFSSS